MEIIDKLIFATAFLAALGSGLIAGLFFVFSNAVMKALGRLPAADGMAAMQSVNSTILNPLFLTVFMGTGLISVIAVVFAAVYWRDAGSMFLLAGGILYLVGSLLVTIALNVPMNNALAAASLSDANAAALWRDYLVNWTWWNHVRTIASLASMAAFVLALAYRAAR